MSREHKEDQAQKTRQEKLIGALETIKEVLINDELESVRNSIVKVDSNLTRRLEEMTRETSESIDRLSRELSSRIEALAPKLADLDQKQTKALTELDERTGKATVDLGRQLQEGQAKSEDRVRTLKKGLEQVINEKESALGGEVSKFGQALTAMQTELKQQIEATQRVSGLLSNMATVFATGPQAVSEQSVAHPPMTVPDPEELVIVPEGDENLDNALDRAFKADPAPVDQDAVPAKK